jgi:predicted RNase H-like HicB family nuclease
MTELVFLVEEDPEGGFTARGVGESIFTQGETLDALRENVRDAVRCHYEEPGARPKVVRLHFVRDEVIAL